MAVFLTSTWFRTCPFPKTNGNPMQPEPHRYWPYKSRWGKEIPPTEGSSIVAMKAKLVIVSAFAFAIAIAQPLSQDTMVVHESRQTIPSSFTYSGPAPADAKLKLRLQLTQSNLAGLEQAMYAASTPGSLQYGHHLSKQQV